MLDDTQSEIRRFTRLLEGLDEKIRLLRQRATIEENQRIAETERADHAEHMVEHLETMLKAIRLENKNLLKALTAGKKEIEG